MVALHQVYGLAWDDRSWRAADIKLLQYFREQSGSEAARHIG